MIESLRERIHIQKSAAEKDKNGNRILKWSDFYTCAAYANNLSGEEYWAAAQVNAQTDMYFVVRYCSELKALDTDHSVLFSGMRFTTSFLLIMFSTQIKR